MHRKSQNKKLTAREEKFCLFYVIGGNAREAAMQAGFQNPGDMGEALIYHENIAAEIRRLFKIRKESLCGRVCAGYERLAFGSIADAIRLMYCENPLNENLEQYDLFNISEIRRLKDNTMEVKFFDRLKALEKLSQTDNEETSGAASFYRALAGQSVENGNEETEAEN